MSMSDPTPENLIDSAAAFDAAYGDRFPHHFPHNVSVLLRAAAERITALEADKVRLRAVIDEMATDPSGDYYTGLRCGVEDRSISCRYEAVEYGWQQAFEYIGSIAANIGGG